jgi:hypothetical protein
MATANEINEMAEKTPKLEKRIAELESLVKELQDENAAITSILDALTKEEETSSAPKPSPPKSTVKK